MKINGTIRYTIRPNEGYQSLEDVLSALATSSLASDSLDWIEVVRQLRFMGIVFEKVDSDRCLREAKDYIKEHLAEACEELVQREYTTQLSMGHVMHVAKMLELVDNDAQTLAEKLVQSAAVHKAAKKENSR